MSRSSGMNDFKWRVQQKVVTAVALTLCDAMTSKMAAIAKPGMSPKEVLFRVHMQITKFKVNFAKYALLMLYPELQQDADSVEQPLLMLEAHRHGEDAVRVLLLKTFLVQHALLNEKGPSTNTTQHSDMRMGQRLGTVLHAAEGPALLAECCIRPNRMQPLLHALRDFLEASLIWEEWNNIQVKRSQYALAPSEMAFQHVLNSFAIISGLDPTPTASDDPSAAWNVRDEGFGLSYYLQPTTNSKPVHGLGSLMLQSHEIHRICSRVAIAAIVDYTRCASLQPAGALKAKGGLRMSSHLGMVELRACLTRSLKTPFTFLPRGKPLRPASKRKPATAALMDLFQDALDAPSAGGLVNCRACEPGVFVARDALKAPEVVACICRALEWGISNVVNDTRTCMSVQDVVHSIMTTIRGSFVA